MEADGGFLAVPSLKLVPVRGANGGVFVRRLQGHGSNLARRGSIYDVRKSREITMERIFDPRVSKSSFDRDLERRGNRRIRQGQAAQLAGGVTAIGSPISGLASFHGGTKLAHKGRDMIAQRPRTGKALIKLGGYGRKFSPVMPIAALGGALGTVVAGQNRVKQGQEDTQRVRLRQAGIIKSDSYKLRQMTSQDKLKQRWYERGAGASAAAGAASSLGAGAAALSGINDYTKMQKMATAEQKLRQAQRGVKGQGLERRRYMGPYPKSSAEYDAKRQAAYKLGRSGARKLRAVGPLLAVGAAGTVGSLALSNKAGEVGSRKNARQKIMWEHRSKGNGIQKSDNRVREYRQ